MPALIGPYVTSVGGTYDHSPEAAIAFSSGGFSNYFSRPAYQEYAVPLYLMHLEDRPDLHGYYKWVFLPWFDPTCSKFCKFYSATSRGYPDMAAQAYEFAYRFMGQDNAFRGTSCSAPVRLFVFYSHSLIHPREPS